MIAVMGPQARCAIEAVFRPSRRGHLPPPGRAALGWLVDQGQRLDESLLVATGQGWELHLHGGPAVVQAALRALEQAGAVLCPADHAPPSLPTIHPRWINPAIGAELQRVLPRAMAPRTAALLAAQWSGGLSALARETWEQTMSQASPRSDLPARLRRCAQGLGLVERLLAGPEVVLAGPPNAGKSTLANLLVGRAVAIVSDTPGTTRDWVRELAVLDDLPVWITDTAGLWSPGDDLDRQAVQRAWSRLAQADLILWLSTPDSPPPPEPLAGDGRLLPLRAQCDVRPALAEGEGQQPLLAISAVTEEGIDALKATILTRLGLAELDLGQPRAFTQRQADLLLAAARGWETGDRQAARAALETLLGHPAGSAPRG